MHRDARTKGLRRVGLWPAAFRETADRLTQIATEERNDRIWEGHFFLRIDHVFWRQIVRDHEQRHVTNDFRRRRHFNDVAEQAVHFSVALYHFGPAVLDPQTACLLA